MPVKISTGQVEQWRSELPELPRQRRERYVTELGLPAYDAGVLTADMATSDWFEIALQHTKNAKAVSNFIMGEMMRLLSEQEMVISESKVTPEKLAEIIVIIDAKTISTGAGKQVFEIIFNEGGDPKQIVEEKGMTQVSDDSALEGWADEAIANNPKPVEEYKAGNAASVNFLMGQVMKASRGKANPGAVMQMLKQKLDG
jgi:aspartyl-tRNA(Asn)/glutamyl-tRNA(Gln) amidotransferase subunit B